ncbi:Tex family protein [Chordicoccus furentiruminis]|uniref:Tex family protein n=1 Tax=Chordicoccus furentiruminis TaxID=2709410 RepID=UPI0023A83B77|nr:Tex family protein [Chordicoccus furentiruminis]
MKIAEQIAEELHIQPWQAEAVISLIDEGNTIPFIARYRKEKHGELNDEQIRNLSERLTYLRNLEDRRAAVRASIAAQGKMTKELSAAIDGAETLVALEDIYRPYKQKRRTRAVVAREKGLEGLARIILEQKIDHPLEEEAQKYVDPEKGVNSAGEAIAGASDIIAEMISDNAEFRTRIRDFTRKSGILVSAAKDPDAKSVYEMYYNFQEPVSKITGYRVLAINRGEKENFLTVKIDVDVRKIILMIGHTLVRGHNRYTVPVLTGAMQDSYKRLIGPAIEREIRNELTQKAEDGAIRVFDKNLEQLLMQPPIAGQVVLGWDPGYAHGCKLAVVEETGKVLDTAVVYPVPPSARMKANPRKAEETKKLVRNWIEKYHVTLIALGNGTASRESEQFIVDLLREIPGCKVRYVVTNEAGASVYSASKLAAEEFPDFDVEQRGAASMARRVQDPLAELVKIDPKAIGVGQYQHDMNQKRLDEALGGVVEDCVNRVGVDLNTASAPLMEHVSGISRTLAKNIVAFREKNGRFVSRRELLKVPKLGPKAFEQCAGFLRIRGGSEPLDNTGVHPESYQAADSLIRDLGLDKHALFASGSADGPRVHVRDYRVMAAKLGIGEPTLKDIVKELNAPGRDPREDMPKPILRSDVLTMDDLKAGMVLKGTVRNIVDFGAFVDIGVHQDGLVHVSKMSDEKFVKHPLDVVSVGDVIDVKVISVDPGKKRIGLSMIL